MTTRPGLARFPHACPWPRPWCLALVVAALGAAIVQADGPRPTPSSGPPPPVIFGVSDGNAPFSSLVDGVPRGFDVDVVTRAATRAGVTLHVVVAPPADLLDGLRQGRVDIAMLARTADREGDMEFLEQTWTLRQALVFTPGRSRYPQKIQDLADETVAVQSESAAQAALDRMPASTRPRVRLVDSTADLVGLLHRGAVSSAIGNALAIDHYQQALGGPPLVEIPDRRLAWCVATRLGHGARPDLQRLSSAIAGLRESGELSELVERHLGTPESRVDWTEVRNRAIAVGLLACAVIGVVVAWNRSLRRKVHHQTRALREALDTAERHLADLERTTAALQRSVSAERQRETQLAAMRDQALEATAAKSAFLAMMSHELRTPLNGVIGMTTLLLDSPLTREQRDQAETIRQCGTLLLDQVNEVLDFSRVEAGKLELESAPFELRGLLDDTLQIVAERAHARGLELMMDADGSLPSTVVGDAGRLRQVVLNLLGNAIKFTETGAVALTVRAVAPDRVGFEVVDTGIGIPADAIPRLFQPFSQADRSTTRRFGGTGLGLAICRQLVALMSGEIGVESEPGRGSRFWFEISLPAGEALDVPLPALPRGHRALVVDDHPRHRTILGAMLSRLNVEVTLAASIDEATALLAATWEDRSHAVVVLDAELEGAHTWMPGGAQPPAILALTADAGRLAAPAHWSAILPRPVREPLFAATVARLVGSPALPRVATSELPAPSAERGSAGSTPELAPDLLILVVDDNAINQRVATRSLEKLGCRVDTAQNGREALDAAARTSYALILMDCQMPEMDGYEATRLLRVREAGGPRTPIVAMTAGARAEDRDACLASGMDDYLSKPFALDDLRRIVARWAVLPVRS